MPRIRVKTVGDGQHPSEAVVSLVDADGQTQELIVDKRSIKDGTLRIGYPIRATDNRFLVELPRETMRGTWRVWVKRDAVLDKEIA